MSDHREQIKQIRTFPSLVRFLRDELDWPVATDDFEDLTFDYAPEELGIDAANAAKIEEIKRLRPFVANQPWGIFFVKFEPKQMPVVALRRILNSVVVKKRATASAAEQQKWATDDLLFISNYGEDEERKISFAHFSQDPSRDDLPTLRVLAWDDLDTPLHLEHAASTLVERLSWPSSEDEWDDESWRERWRSAFELRHREVVTTSKALAEKLAQLARAIRERIRGVLEIETDDGPVTGLMKAFREALIHDLDAADFADMYAQTIAYGLLSARVANPSGDGSAAHLPVTNPFLKDLMETFLHVGGRNAKAARGPGIDFDELGVSEVVELLDDANMEAVLRDFGDRNPQEDPVIHFYELFIKEYDAENRMRRGVFYTPRPVVSYIVRSVDELLCTEFGLQDGLADTTSWGEMAKRHKDLKIPDGIEPGQPFVQILDPATGTGTFLVEVIDLIHKTLVAKWILQGRGEKTVEALWNEYVPKHLLPRLHGYELLMAPYAIAHLKVGLKLHETGYRFESSERARIYLTNALEPPNEACGRFEFAIPALAHEGTAVNAIKESRRFTVVIGNPPYAVTSSNSNPHIDGLMEDYKKHVRGETGLVALADDYLKFVRMSQSWLAISGCGVWGMITNHGFVKGVIHRGVRKELLDQFETLYVLDLHGDSNVGERPPDGRANENVFDIQQGVAISIGCDNPAKSRSVQHSDAWGTRAEKYKELSARSVLDTPWSLIEPAFPGFFLFPFDDTNQDEYDEFPQISDVMPVHSCGVKTHRDGLVIDHDKDVLTSRMSDVATNDNLEEIRGAYGIKDTPHWNLESAQAKIRGSDIAARVHRLTYRPFDQRWLYYNPAIIEKSDSKYPTLRHMLDGNVALLSSRIQATGTFDAAFVADTLVEMKTAESSRSCTVFPLYLVPDAEATQGGLPGEGRTPNLSAEFLAALSQRLGQTDDSGLPAGIRAEDVLNYFYAVLYSPGYRSRYSPYLQIDYPRIPIPPNRELFFRLGDLGSQLVRLHLVDAPEQRDVNMVFSEERQAWAVVGATGVAVKDVGVSFLGPKEPTVGKIAWSDDTVWIDAVKSKKAGVAGTVGFTGVPEEVWNMRIGGYPVCLKWLKDRGPKAGNPGRTLAPEDISHYLRMIVALRGTLQIQRQIDEVIGDHGGWPAAFK